jgi:hypothetical protein
LLQQQQQQPLPQQQQQLQQHQLQHQQHTQQLPTFLFQTNLVPVHRFGGVLSVRS